MSDIWTIIEHWLNRRPMAWVRGDVLEPWTSIRAWRRTGLDRLLYMLDEDGLEGESGTDVGNPFLYINETSQRALAVTSDFDLRGFTLGQILS